MYKTNDGHLRYLKSLNSYQPIKIDKIDGDDALLRLNQYENLRIRFANTVAHILGDKYYNDAYDVYESDKRCCDALVNKFDELELKVSFWRRVSKSGLICSIGLLLILIIFHLI